MLGVTFGFTLMASGVAAHSLSLCMLSTGYVEMACVSGLQLAAFRRSRHACRRLAILLQFSLLLPLATGAFVLVGKIRMMDAPVGTMMAGAAGLALLFRVMASGLLAACQAETKTPYRDALMTMRRDGIGGVAVLLAGIITGYIHSPWPDACVSAGVLALFVGSPREIWKAAQSRRWLAPEDWLV
ncbi:hypothetical protein [Sphingomonas oryzagri]